jgi:aspartyl protease family protein
MGLTKNGGLYLLPGEKDIDEEWRPLMVAKNKFDQDTRNRKVYEDKIKYCKGYIAEMTFQRKQLDEKLTRVTDATTYNQMRAKISVIDDNIKEATDAMAQQQAALAAQGEDTLMAFMQKVEDLGKKSDELAKEYAKLAASPDVKTALAAVKGRLGPSSEFLGHAHMLTFLKGKFTTDTIPIKVEGNVPTVDVILNGKVTRSLVVDSGASVVVIPADLAKDLGLVPGPDDPVVHYTMADGRAVEARSMKLKSVQVGMYKLENVECAVLPPNLVSADALLGESFLKNFVPRLDLENKELHLAKIGGPQAKSSAEKP